MLACACCFLSLRHLPLWFKDNELLNAEAEAEPEAEDSPEELEQPAIAQAITNAKAAEATILNFFTIILTPLT